MSSIWLHLVTVINSRVIFERGVCVGKHIPCLKRNKDFIQMHCLRSVSILHASLDAKWVFSIYSTHNRLDDCFDVTIVDYSGLCISMENAWIDRNTTHSFTIILRILFIYEYNLWLSAMVQCRYVWENRR